MFMTSAPSRLPASSKEDWVRVEASKNRLICVRPRSEVRLFLDLAVELDEFLGKIEEAGDVVKRKAPRCPADGVAPSDEGGRTASCSLKGGGASRHRPIAAVIPRRAMLAVMRL